MQSLESHRSIIGWLTVLPPASCATYHIAAAAAVFHYVADVSTSPCQILRRSQALSAEGRNPIIRTIHPIHIGQCLCLNTLRSFNETSEGPWSDI
ncbi:hypothetical protein IW261DRAFT_300903 [Armillaria novae-zelandiae]|uniref:Uncharacterized protein n=1 Tax=Armillaria novae-zelandiae TaxID=153914 RepID=A0AA39UCA4_9AGAR|nr:hypothetical protein IW261DRAFT_300903 [Armillaria novae-zelandiae]